MPGEDVFDSMMTGIRYFQEKGYRIFAIVHNETGHLGVVSNNDDGREILLLHANISSESKQGELPPHSGQRAKYHLAKLIPEKRLPKQVQLVWHGVNDDARLSPQFDIATRVHAGLLRL